MAVRCFLFSGTFPFSIPLKCFLEIVDIYEGIEDRDSNMIVWYREDLRALVTVIGDVSTEELIAVLEALVP